MFAAHGSALDPRTLARYNSLLCGVPDWELRVPSILPAELRGGLRTSSALCSEGVLMLGLPLCVTGRRTPFALCSRKAAASLLRARSMREVSVSSLNSVEYLLFCVVADSGTRLPHAVGLIVSFTTGLVFLYLMMNTTINLTKQKATKEKKERKGLN